MKRAMLAAAGCLALSGVVQAFRPAVIAAPDPPVTKDQGNKWMTELSNWGRWGKADQIGTLNLITPDKRRQALKLVRDGVAVSLAHTIDKEKAADNPRPLGQEMVLDAGGHAMDLYSIWYHGSVITHIDSLCHYSFEGKIFNGFERSAIAPGPGCPSNGIENQKAGIITRGIIVDLPRMKNLPYLEPGTAIYVEDLEAWEKKSGVKITSGDAVLLRTGRWARREKLGPWNVGQSAAGLHASVAPWIKARGVAFLGSDAAEDVTPSMVEGITLPIHTLMITGLGMNLLDNQDLEALGDTAARLNRWEFMLTIAPVPVTGGTGFPLNAIAMF